MSEKRAHKSVAWLAHVTALVLLAAPVHAEPRYSFSSGTLSITLTDELCTLKGEISNLPRRSVWKQDGVETEGCWGYSEQFGLILLYFKDKTATALPAPLFSKVNGV